jgi:hypothetical protein
MSNNPPQWWTSGQQAVRDQRKDQQVRAIQSAFQNNGKQTGWSPVGGPARAMNYMFEERTLLARDSDVAAVRQSLGAPPVAVAASPVPGISIVTIPAGHPFENHDAAMAQVAGLAMPNHVAHIAPAGACPATEPVVPSAGGPVPPVSTHPTATGQGISIEVVDTGLLAAAMRPTSTWFNGVTGTPEPLGLVGPHYGGHGTFVAGVLRTMAPRASVNVRKLFVWHGAILEDELASALQAALAAGPHIISMSAGMTTYGGGVPLALESVCQGIQASVTLLVAAAGNDCSPTELFYPAAFAPNNNRVVAVGALDASNTAQAGYSNTGPWVSVFAQGSDLVNGYPPGAYVYQEPPMVGQPNAIFGPAGLAQWSGTSFATPLVAGLVAAHMSRTGEADPLTAWNHLKNQSAVPSGGFRTLRPGDADVGP